MNETWIAYAKNNTNDIVEIGRYPNMADAMSAVLDAIEKLELHPRCLFRWENGIYRCGEDDKHIWGSVAVVVATPISTGVVRFIEDKTYPRYESLEYMVDGLHVYNALIYFSNEDHPLLYYCYDDTPREIAERIGKQIEIEFKRPVQIVYVPEMDV